MYYRDGCNKQLKCRVAIQIFTKAIQKWKQQQQQQANKKNSHKFNYIDEPRVRNIIHDNTQWCCCVYVFFCAKLSYAKMNTKAHSLLYFYSHTFRTNHRNQPDHLSLFRLLVSTHMRLYAIEHNNQGKLCSDCLILSYVSTTLVWMVAPTRHRLSVSSQWFKWRMCGILQILRNTA